MASPQQEQPPTGAYNMGHRHSLTIETNPLHLLPSNMRRFSQADTARHPAAPLLSKLAARQQIAEENAAAAAAASGKADDKADK
ncbi:unnamed protein product [Caenorhabditis angaria]|uniref:Uncharacterized protein n=1 Tax=Caenorhabditis angaria TaxID=860376 RepID=A0A9P1IEM1_9PELO|nr:unnamed protein product [Caenorhabditis angaria]